MTRPSRSPSCWRRGDAGPGDPARPLRHRRGSAAARQHRFHRRRRALARRRPGQHSATSCDPRAGGAEEAAGRREGRRSARALRHGEPPRRQPQPRARPVRRRGSLRARPPTRGSPPRNTASARCTRRASASTRTSPRRATSTSGRPTRAISSRCTIWPCCCRGRHRRQGRLCFGGAMVPPGRRARPARQRIQLAILVARGLGSAVDLAEAYKWFALAAAQGDTDAASKRDEIGAKLDADSLGKAKAATAAFVPRNASPIANDATLPGGLLVRKEHRAVRDRGEPASAAVGPSAD